MRRSVGIALAATVMMAVGCASGDKKEGKGGKLGDTSAAEGETTVSTREQVIVERQREIPTVRITTLKADLNRLEPAHLEALGVPKKVAGNIVEYRKDQDGFESVEQLQEVDGVSEQLYAELAPKVAVREKATG